MKKLAWIVVALIVVLVLAVGVAPYFINWNSQKERISAQVRQTTGRSLSIDGDIRLHLFPTPTLSAAGVAFGNITGGQAEHMLELEKVDVRVALWPLLEGQVQIDSIELIRPTIILESLADGRTNYEFPQLDQTTDSAPATSPTNEGPPLDLRLDHMRIVDGTVIFRDLESGSEERLQNITANLQAASLEGPFSADGTVRQEDKDITFTLKTGSLRQKPTAVSLVMALEGARDSMLRFQGDVAQRDSGINLTGKLSASSEDLPALVSQLQEDSGPVPFESINYTSNLTFDGSSLVVDDIALQLDNISASGKLQANFADTTNVNGAFQVGSLNIDPILESLNTQGAPKKSDANKQNGQTSGLGFTLPQNLDLSLLIGADVITYQQQIIRNTTLEAKMQNGQAEISRFTAELPGSTDLSISGDISTDEQPAKFIGRVEATSDNLRALLTWLGADVAQVPADRLRRMAYTSTLQASMRQIDLSEIDLQIDTSRVRGGIITYLQERMAFGIGLSVDQLNLDAYLPSLTQLPQDDDAQDANGAGQNATNPLNAFDANFDLRAGSLTARGQTLAGVKLAGALDKGVLVLKQAEVDDAAGASVKVSGTFSGLPQTPSVKNGVFSLNVKDPQRFNALAGNPADGLLVKLGTFDITGSFSGAPENFTTDTTFQAFGGSGRFSGTVKGVPDAPVISNGNLKLTQVNGAQMLRLGDITSGPLTTMGPVDLSSTFQGSMEKLDLDATLAALGAQLSVKGSASNLASEVPASDVTFALQHPNARKLFASLMETPPSLPQGDVDFAGRLQTGAKTFSISDLNGSFAGSNVAGTMSYDATQEKAKVLANLETGALPIDLFLGTEKGEQGGAKPKGAARWSNETFDLSALREMDADITLKASQISYGDNVVNNSDVRAVLTQGVLNLERFTGTYHGGSITASGTANASNPQQGLTLAMTMNAQDIQSQRMLVDTADFDRISGPVSMDLQLNGQGTSEAQLVSSLNGSGQINGVLTVTPKAEEAVGSLLLNILGTKVKQVQNISNATSLIFASFTNAPAQLSGNFQVEQGVATTQDLTLTGRGANAVAQGVLANLPAWTMDLVTQVYRGEGQDPYLRLTLKGPVNSPNISVGGQALLPGTTQDGTTQQQIPSPIPGVNIPDIIPGLNLPNIPGFPQSSPPPSSEQTPAIPSAPQTAPASEPEAAVAPAAPTQEAAPAAEEEAAPAAAEEVAPAAEEVAPVAEEEAAPVAAEEAAPAAEETTPAAEEEAAPAAEETTPAAEEEAAPAAEEAVKPAEEAQPEKKKKNKKNKKKKQKQVQDIKPEDALKGLLNDILKSQ